MQIYCYFSNCYLWKIKLLNHFLFICALCLTSNERRKSETFNFKKMIKPSKISFSKYHFTKKEWFEWKSGKINDEFWTMSNIFSWMYDEKPSGQNRGRGKVSGCQFFLKTYFLVFKIHSNFFFELPFVATWKGN